MAHSIDLIRPPVKDGELKNYGSLRTAPGPYVMNGDFLRLNATSTSISATVAMNGRVLRVDGEIFPFTISMTITGAGDQTAVPIPLVDGWIIGFDVFISVGTITDGQIVASVDVVQGSGTGLTRVMNLASGEITNTRALGLGAYLLRGPVTSAVQPTVASTLLANPAAGAEAIFTVPATEVWQIQSFNAVFTTAVAVAVRRPALVVTNGTTTLLTVMSQQTQAASLANAWSSFVDAEYFDAGAAGVFTLKMPVMLLGGGYVFKTSTINIQAADQWSSCIMSYIKR